VFGSLVSLLDSIPTLTRLRPAVLAVLAIDGVLSAVAGAFFLPMRIGSVPFPISALLSGLCQRRAGMGRTSMDVPRRGWPHCRCGAGWLTVAGLSFGGPG